MSYDRVFPTNPQADAEGIDRRDYFAAHALAGILAQTTIGPTESGGTCGDPSWEIRNSGDCRIVAEGAYRIADAMLLASKSEKAVPA